MKTTTLRVWLTAAIGVIGALLSACNGSGSSGAQSVATTSTATQLSGPAVSPSQPTPTTAAQYNAVTLSWTPPTENTNGSALTNLAGYYVYYGTQSQYYTSKIQVDNPGIATYVVDNLPPGTYYFALQAYDSTGTLSPLSQEVSRTVN